MLHGMMPAQMLLLQQSELQSVWCAHMVPRSCVFCVMLQVSDIPELEEEGKEDITRVVSLLAAGSGIEPL